MFRLKKAGLPPDPSFPTNLKDLDFTITPDGLVRHLSDPKKEYNFRVSDSDRYNERRKEAINDCVREYVVDQLAEYDIWPVKLCSKTSERPGGPGEVTEPHVSILATDLDKLEMSNKVVVIINDSVQDLGIWAWRVATGHDGLFKGSALGVVKELFPHGYCRTGSLPAVADCIVDPAIVIMNPGQLCYSPSLNTSMSITRWKTRTMDSESGLPLAIDETWNKVEGHKLPEDHIRSVWQEVVMKHVHEDKMKYLAGDTKIYVVGIGRGGDHFIEMLREDARNGKQYDIAALALMYPTVQSSSTDSGSLRELLREHTRAWVLSPEPTDTLIEAPLAPTQPSQHDNIDGIDEYNDQLSISRSVEDDDGILCPTCSSGQEAFVETIFPAVYKQVLQWFEGVEKMEGLGLYDWTEDGDVDFAGLKLRKSLVEQAGLL